MIIVTGATGQLGSQIVTHLLARVPAERVGVSVRDPDRAAGLSAAGVRVRRGDFTEPESLAEAFEDATQVLIVSSNETSASAVSQHTAAIDAARAAGAERVLYTSHQGAATDSLFAPMPDHAATEGHLTRSGEPFTSLHNGFYASTVPLLLGQAVETSELVAPADGPVSWTAHADLAEVAAIVLAGEASYEGATPPLTAPDAFDLADVAAMLTRLTGRSITRVVVPDHDFLTGMTERGTPDAAAAMMLGMFRASRRGEFAATDPTLERLLGRPATPLTSLLDELVASR